MRTHPRGTARRRTGTGRRTRSTAFVFVMSVGILTVPATAAAEGPFVGPVFGLGTGSEGNVVVATVIDDGVDIFIPRHTILTYLAEVSAVPLKQREGRAK